MFALRALLARLRASVTGWRRLRHGYALLAGVLVGLANWLMHGHGESLLSGLGSSLLLCALTFLLTLLGLRLGQGAARQQLDLLRVELDGALQRGEAPALQSTGWPEFDALRAALAATLMERADRVASLNQQVDYYRLIAEGTQGLEAYFSPRGRLLWVNPAVEKLTGYTPNECYVAPDLIELWVYQKDRPQMRELAARGRAGEAREDHELRLVGKDGRTAWYSCRWYPQQDAQGKMVGLRFSAQSIQSRKDAELKLLENVAALRRAQALKEHYLSRSNDERMRLASLLDTVQLGIVFIDRDRRVVYINQPAVDLWRLGEREALVGVRDEVLMEKGGACLADPMRYLAHVEEVLSLRGRSQTYDIRFADGRIINEVSSLVSSSDGSRAIGRVWVFEDVTAARLAQQRLTELAERDPLTGLYNRRRFLEELDRQLADAARREEEVGLISFDLDGFKHINDNFGHQAGDQVLIEIANQVGAIVRRNELFFRLGGDEFAILVANTDEESMAQLARRVLVRAAEQRFLFRGKPAAVTVSLGFALAPRHSRTPMGLVAAADRAMYAAKAHGKNRWEVALDSDDVSLPPHLSQ